MTDSAWVSIAAFTNVADAEAASRKLADADIESLILGPDDQPVTKEYVGQCYVWIPEELTEDADLELTRFRGHLTVGFRRVHDGRQIGPVHPGV